MKRRTGEPRKVNSYGRIQYAALPYRGRTKSELQVMLVTSRGTRRWVIPKGWPKSGMPPHQTAAAEAFEEGGVAGKVTKRPIGAYSYDKLLKNGTNTRCVVRVFALRVVREHKKWPEKHQRRIGWYSPGNAAQQVREPSLRRIIRGFAKRSQKTV